MEAASIYVLTLPQTNRVIMIPGNGPWFLSYKTVGNNLSNVGGNVCKLNFCCFKLLTLNVNEVIYIEYLKQYLAHNKCLISVSYS